MQLRRRGVDLADAVVVVTGASSGIGRETAIRFARKKSHVVLAARSESALRETADACRKSGVRALVVPTDVADDEAVDVLAEQAVRQLGRIDVWVNVAGVMSYGTVEDTPNRVHRRIVETNLLGTMYGARAAVPVLRQQGSGVIINVGSLYSRATSPYVAGYAASKFGVMGFTQVLRQELKAERGIHVCLVMPGSMDTPIFGQAANYTGHRAKPVPPIASPVRVARAIVRCAEHPHRRRTIGNVQHLAAWGHALLPHVYADTAPVAMRHVALGHEPVPDDDGNVFESVPGGHAPRGGWRSVEARVAGGVGVALAAGGVAVAAGRSRHR